MAPTGRDGIAQGNALGLWEHPTGSAMKGREEKLAEREGFEPPVGISYARFPGVCLKPLSHLSASKA